MDRRRTCVEQAEKGMTIYFLEPGKNVIRKILVKEAKPDPWNPVVKESTLSNPVGTVSNPSSTGHVSSRTKPISTRKRSLRTTSKPITTSKSGNGKGKVKFCGFTGECKRVVFLIDANGVMGKTFNSVFIELMRSIGRLRSNMEFSVIVMTDGKGKTFPAKGFQKAIFKEKMAASKFLEKIKAAGQTDMAEGMKEVLKRLGKTDIPSNAFVVLSSLTKARAKTILTMVNKAKLPKTSKINTVYLGKPSKEDIVTLKKIADVTGGKFIRMPIR
jgi:hypothetical protein